MFKAIVRLADRNLLVRAINGSTVVYDSVFTKNDALDIAEATSLGFAADTQRNPNRFLTAPLDQFAVRAAKVGVYIPGADQALKEAGFSIAA
jgi:hypothetical protein